MRRLLSLVLATFFSMTAQAQLSYLDTSFNHTGKRTQLLSPTQNWGSAVALDSGGNVLIAGYAYFGKWQFAMMRLRPDGSLDSSLRKTGMLNVSTPYKVDMANAIAITPGQKITLAGFSSDGTTDFFAVMRFLQNGNADSSFGINGVVYTAGILEGRAYAVIVQPDHRTIVAGVSYHDGLSSMTLLRLLEDGRPDSSFGTGGIVYTRVLGDPGFVRTMALLPDGRILAGGVAYPGLGQVFALARFLDNGSLDTSFATVGMTQIPVGPAASEVKSLLLRDDGSVVAVGEADAGSPLIKRFAMAGILPNGKLDPDFGQGGKVLPLSGQRDMFVAGAVQLSNGRIVLGGVANDGSRENFSLARFLPDGSTDTSFNGTGSLISPIGNNYSYITGMAVQPDDKIVAAGWCWGQASANEFAVARFLPAPKELPNGIKVKHVPVSDARISPNPATTSVQLSYTLYRAGPVIIRLLDVTGRLLHTWESGASQAAGAQRLQLQLPDGMAAGSYFISVGNGSSSAVQLKLLKH